MNFILSAFVSILTIFLFLYNTQAQVFQFRNFTEETGFHENGASCIMQTNDSYLWIGTPNSGLLQFDGINVNVFHTSAGLNSNTINAILQDSENQIWVGTDKGLCLLRNGKVIINKDTEPFQNIAILCLLQDNEENIWIGTQENGLYIYKKEKLEHYTNEDGISNNVITCLYQDSKSTVWFGTYWGLNKAIPDNGKIKFETFYTEHGLNNNVISSINEDKKGNLWIGTYEGVSIFLNNNFSNAVKIYNLQNHIINDLLIDLSGNLWISIRDSGVARFNLEKYDYESNEIPKEYTSYISKKNGLVSNNIDKIFHDSEQNIWFLSSEGISQYQEQAFIYYTNKDGLSNDKVWSIWDDTTNGLWIGTYNGGICHFDGSTFVNYSETRGLASNKVYCMLPDKQKNIWIGTSDGVSFFNGKNFRNLNTSNGLSNNIVWSVLPDSKGNVWFGTMNGASKFILAENKFVNYNVNEGLAHKQVSSILEDTQGNIWFGTMGGLSKFNGSTFTNFTKENQLPSNLIGTILEDENGNIWLGTFDEGMVKLVNASRKDNPEIRRITIKDGLNSNEVLLMIFDGSHNLWAGNKNGLNKMDMNTYNLSGNIKIKKYGIEKGEFLIKCNQNAVCMDHLKNLWFGTENGLLKFNPLDEKINEKEPNIIITKYMLHHKDTVLPQNTTLTYEQNHWAFSFTGLCFTDPKKIYYRYMLEGFDDKWSPETKNNNAVYSNLSPGTYSFKVIACNNEGIWNYSPAFFSFKIKPPFWQTWWFYSCTSGLMILFIYLFIRFRTLALKREKDLLENMVENRTLELKEEKNRAEQFAEKLKESNEDLKSFAYVVSHDLQAPLRKIRFILQNILNDKAEDQQLINSEKLSDIDRTSERMQLLIKGLLDFSRLNTQAHVFEPTDLNKIIAEVLNDMEPLIKDVNGKVVVSNLPTIHADKLQMRQLFQNLIANSIKFHKKNIPPIVKINCKNKSNQFWEITVEDNGVGFEEKYSGKLFKPFQKLHSGKDFEGTGLGMSICYKIMEKHKGKISAKSIPGTGTIFFVTLPYDNND